MARKMPLLFGRGFKEVKDGFWNWKFNDNRWYSYCIYR